MSHHLGRKLWRKRWGSVQSVAMAMILMMVLNGEGAGLGAAESTDHVSNRHMQKSTNQPASSKSPDQQQSGGESLTDTSRIADTEVTSQTASTKSKVTAPSNLRVVTTALRSRSIGLISTAQLGVNTIAGTMVNLGREHTTFRQTSGVVTLRPANSPNYSSVSAMHTGISSAAEPSVLGGQAGPDGIGGPRTTISMTTTGNPKGGGDGPRVTPGSTGTSGTTSGTSRHATTLDPLLQYTTHAGPIITQGSPAHKPISTTEPLSTPPPLSTTSLLTTIHSTLSSFTVSSNGTTSGHLVTSSLPHHTTAQPPVRTELLSGPQTMPMGSDPQHSTSEGPSTKGQQVTTSSPFPWLGATTSSTGANSSEVEPEVTIVRREATTSSDNSAGKCDIPQFIEVDSTYSASYSFIQPLDDVAPYTRLALSGVGSGGGDTWDLNVTFVAEDSSTFVNFGRHLIPGEEYIVTRRWCINETCPRDGECSPIGPVKKEFKFRTFDTVTLVDADTTTAVLSWRLQQQAYLPGVRFLLNLTNDGTFEDGTAQTFNTTGTYSREGLFAVVNLTSGARYIMDFDSGTRVVPLVTAPEEPGDISFTQPSHNIAELSWHQGGFADNFTITYGEIEEPSTTVVVYNTSVELEDLSYNTTYSISVYAQTGNHKSPPASYIFHLNPPSLTIEILHQDTTWIEFVAYPPEILAGFRIYANRVEKESLHSFDASRTFNITDLTPGMNHRIKFAFQTGEFKWQQTEEIATEPLPPSGLSVDNSIHGYLDVSWAQPVDGGVDGYRIAFNSSGSVKTIKHSDVRDLCHREQVEGGIHFVISMVAISNGLESIEERVETVSAPASPTIEETGKSTSSVSFNISCPGDGSSDRVHYSLCPLGSDDCFLMYEFPCDIDGTTESISQDGLVPGERYQFKAKSSRVIDGLRAESDIVTYNFTTHPLPPSEVSALKITGLEITLTWVSTCLHCTFTIHAKPHRKTLVGVMRSSPCLDRLHNRCEYTLVVVPEEFYDIVVTSRAWDEESLTGTTVYNISMPTAIKHVTNIQLESLTPTVVALNFDPPEVPMEEITHYIVEYPGRRENGDSCSQALPDKWIRSNIERPLNFTVKGGCWYNFTIQAYFGGLTGEIAWKSVQTKTGALKQTTLQPRNHGQLNHRSFIVTFDPQIFDDEYGPIENFTVVVAEAMSIMEQLSGPLSIPLSLPGWAESIRHDPIPPYQAFPVSPVYTFGRGISKRSVDIERTYTIGTEECGDDSPRYCNGYLIGGKTYVYWFRGFNEAGFTDTKPSTEFTLPKNQSSLIIGCLVILMILFLIVIILAALLLKKRLHMDSKGSYQQAQADGVHLKALTRKNSTRAKYIRSVKLLEFCQDFHMMSAHSNYGYSQEFENLRKVGRKMTCNDSVLPENVSKNRYTNILPYDKTRVKLDSIDDELGSDYINANYIPGFTSPREYIACQGPHPGTLNDMWRMIWEKNVSVVVMVTQLVEKGKVKCEQYWPEDHRPVFYGDIQVTMTTMNETESWTFRDFNLYKASVDQRKRVKHFNYLSWPDHGVPEDSLSILNFIEAVREAHPKDSSPMVVHCSAGCGRTGTFICLDQLLQQIDEFDYVNILGVASEMRAHRSHMVQTEQQYVFIHRCILDILEDNGVAPRPSSIMMNGNTGGALLMEMV